MRCIAGQAYERRLAGGKLASDRLRGLTAKIDIKNRRVATGAIDEFKCLGR